jgi:hypothetical protein
MDYIEKILAEVLPEDQTFTDLVYQELLASTPVFAGKKKKSRKKHMHWSKEDIEIVPTNPRKSHLHWSISDIKIKKPGKHEVKSWEADWLVDRKKYQTKVEQPPIAHLSPWHREALKDPKHKNIVQEHTDRALKKAKIFSPKDREHVENYQESSNELNRQLRKNGTVETDLKNGWTPHNIKRGSKAHAEWAKNRDQEIKDQVNSLDKVTSHSLRHNTVTYRGVDEGFRTLPKGTVFQDKGYTGTSLDRDIASEFSTDTHSDEGNTTVARIFHKKGHTGAYLPPIAGSHPGEKEFLLPRGSHYKVLGHSWDAKDPSIRYVDMERHDPEPKKPVKPTSKPAPVPVTKSKKPAVKESQTSKNLKKALDPKEKAKLKSVIKSPTKKPASTFIPKGKSPLDVVAPVKKKKLVKALVIGPHQNTQREISSLIKHHAANLKNTAEHSKFWHLAAKLAKQTATEDVFSPEYNHRVQMLRNHLSMGPKPDREIHSQNERDDQLSNSAKLTAGDALNHNFIHHHLFNGHLASLAAPNLRRAARHLHMSNLFKAGKHMQAHDFYHRLGQDTKETFGPLIKGHLS